MLSALEQPATANLRYWWNADSGSAKPGTPSAVSASVDPTHQVLTCGMIIDDKKDSPEREQTDQSLRVEREKTDQALADRAGGRFRAIFAGRQK
ncbi:MAG: hypothetical protein H0X11_08390 [Betaproteobacteria bacterium]|nr:hypothetical protein [Betaproteobacteria bacterium]